VLERFTVALELECAQTQVPDNLPAPDLLLCELELVIRVLIVRRRGLNQLYAVAEVTLGLFRDLVFLVSG
jgi:hypothetical protein